LGSHAFLKENWDARHSSNEKKENGRPETNWIAAHASGKKWDARQSAGEGNGNLHVESFPNHSVKN